MESVYLYFSGSEPRSLSLTFNMKMHMHVRDSYYWTQIGWNQPMECKKQDREKS